MQTINQTIIPIPMFFPRSSGKSGPFPLLLLTSTLLFILGIVYLLAYSSNPSPSCETDSSKYYRETGRFVSEDRTFWQDVSCTFRHPEGPLTPIKGLTGFQTGLLFAGVALVMWNWDKIKKLAK